MKIYVSSTPPDYFTPWSFLNTAQGSGSGSVLSGKQIITNAHVVADARYIQVQKNGDPRKFRAFVSYISHEVDLALLTVEDELFFENIKPIRLGKLPETLEEVSVYGYPFGGQALSITRGILSRLEHQFYAHSGEYFFAGQIDAAINPGNSGGAVMVKGRLVGVVMQANSNGRAENLGYMVPVNVVEHFLENARSAIARGFPILALRTQDMESPSLRARYGMTDDQSGALVVRVVEGSTVGGVIHPGDILLAIDGHVIANDKTVEFRKGERTSYKYFIDLHHPGELIRLDLLRQGRRLQLDVIADVDRPEYTLVPREQFDQLPRYVIYGGVVFVPLTMNLIQRWGSDWRNNAPLGFLAVREEFATDDRKEVIVALKVLASQVNVGYHDWRNWIVDTVNGVKIRDFDHFLELIQSTENGYMVFSDDEGYQMVINHELAKHTEGDILHDYRVPSLGSD
ncbi:MAG: trypsin-like peptidase domain-containing protein [Pseudomonadales bacterium]|nr:trypsin-like peptidase domain-containing protein [Pseudomonadales bacterium]